MSDDGGPRDHPAELATAKKADLVAVVRELGYTRARALGLVDAVFDEVRQALVDGEPVKIVGFGTFEVHEREARTGRHPRTGGPLALEARRGVGFRASRKLRDELTSALGRSEEGGAR